MVYIKNNTTITMFLCMFNDSSIHLFFPTATFDYYIREVRFRIIQVHKVWPANYSIYNHNRSFIMLSSYNYGFYNWINKMGRMIRIQGQDIYVLVQAVV